MVQIDFHGSSLGANISEDVVTIGQNVVQEFSHEQSGSFVLFATLIQLLLKRRIVNLQALILPLGPLKLLLNSLQLLLQKVDKLFVILGLLISGTVDSLLLLIRRILVF